MSSWLKSILDLIRDISKIRWLMPLLAMAFLIILVWSGCALSILVVELPSYMGLGIPAPSEHGWSYSEKAIQHWEYGGTYHIFRQNVTVLREPQFDTRASIMDYFDEWLVDQGWERVDTIGRGRSCNSQPEASFLEMGDNGYTAYTHPDYRGSYSDGTTVCVAVWPVDRDLNVVSPDDFDDPKQSKFEVVLTTIKPSPFTALINDM